MNLWLWASAAAAFFTLLIHLILGGREIARPLLAARGLADVPKYTMYYCWHLVSLMIFAMAAMLAHVAFWGGPVELAWAGLALAAGSMAWSFVMIAALRLRPLWHYPQGWLFALVVALALPGLW